jgi:hypothetical protein
MFYLSVRVGGSNPADSEFAADVTKTVEQMLSDLFTTGEVDIALLTDWKMSRKVGSSMYVTRHQFGIKDVMDKISNIYFSGTAADSSRDYAIWCLTYSWTASTAIDIYSALNIDGRLIMARNRLL